MTSSPAELKEIVQLLNTGRRLEARSRLAVLLQRHPQDEKAWLLLSRAVFEPTQQVECLERALAINPHNQETRRRLAALKTQLSHMGSVPEEKVQTQDNKPPANRSSRPVSLMISDAGEMPLEQAVLRNDEQAENTSEPEAWGAEPLSSFRPGAAEGRDELLTRTASAIYREPANRTVTWMVAGFVVFITVLLLGGGGVGVYTLVAGRQMATAQSKGATATLQARLVLPPTWTPEFSPTSLITPTATATPTPILSATPLAPGPTASVEMDVIRSQVSGLRELPVQRVAPAYLVSTEQAMALLSDTAEAAGLLEGLDHKSRVLAALGLAPGSYDLSSYQLSSLASLEGFYLPWQEQVYLLGGRFSGKERWIFAHAFGQALLDQQFGFDELGVYPRCRVGTEACRAARALILGDALLAAREWWSRHSGQPVGSEPYELSLGIGEPLPLALEQDLRFPYDAGLEFVRVLYKRGGWTAVDKAYDRLPATSEQILHPEKYLSGEEALVLDPAPLEDALEVYWRQAGSGVLGEWWTYLILAYAFQPDQRLDEEVARLAATGWGGDVYQAFVDEASGSVVLSVHWAWDAPSDAARFAVAMLDYQRARYQGRQSQGPAGWDCWEKELEISCTRTWGSETLWVLAPGLETLQAVISVYPQAR
jgi:hypothetical protein